MSKKGWTTVKFGDVVENVRRNIKDREAAGIDRVLGLDDIETGNLHVTGWKDVDSSPSFRTHFKPTQTLFGKRRAYLRKVAYAKFEGVCTQNILVFETKNPEVLLPELLPFICMSEPFLTDAVKHSTGSLFPNADWKSIRDFEFKLPPIHLQKKYAEILWISDSIVNLFSNITKNFELLLCKMSNKFARIDGKTIFLKEVLTRGPSNGVYRPRIDYNLHKGNTKVVRLENLHGLEIDGSEPKMKSVTMSGLESKKYHLSNGDIIVNRVHSIQYLGKSSIISNKVGEISAESNCFYMTPNPKLMRSYHILIQLQSSRFKRYVLSRAKKAIQQASWSQKDLQEFCLRKPPTEVQKIEIEIYKKINLFIENFNDKLQLSLLVRNLIIKDLIGDNFE